MPSSRETNTMAEGLRRMLNEITSMKTMPDGDLEFLVHLETEILSYLRTPTSQDQAMGMNGPDVGGGGLPPGMGAMGGMGSPVPMPMPTSPQLPPGVPANPQMPGGGINPDELRRVLNQ